jgi:hypothetical protein
LPLRRWPAPRRCGRRLAREAARRRACWRIDAPVLESFGGRPVAPANVKGCGFGQDVARVWGGVPIISAWWRLRWLVVGSPELTNPAPTPMN